MNNKMFNFGFVHFQRINHSNEGSVYHVLNRTQRTIGDWALLHLLYTGEVNKEYLNKKNIQCIHFQSGLFKFGILSSVILCPYLIIQVYRFCRNWNLNVVSNLFDHYSFWIVAIGARFAGTKPIMRVVGKPPRKQSASFRQKLRHKIGDFFEKISLFFSWRVLTVSEALASAIDSDGKARDKMYVVSQGVDISHFYPKDDKSVLSKPYKILFVGRLVKIKRLDYLIIVLSRLRMQGYEITLQICGSGPLEDMFKKRLESEHWIEFLGQISFDKLPEVYVNSDLLVLPSISEGLPNVVLEALSCKVPIVASSVGGIPELLRHERGILVPPDDLNQFEDAIREMLINSKLRIECVKNGRDYVQKYHSLERVRDKFNNVLLK